MRVSRTDLATGPRAAVTRLGSGAVRLDAAVTRVGVLTYSDGERTWGELKMPAEVFDPASVATLAGLPVTVDHPPDLVTPETWNDVAVGHVGDAPRPERDTGMVVAPVVVSDAATIARVDAGELVEVSAGYTCEVEEASGTFDGVPYSAVQRGIRYNHVAIGPEGWGRAGADVKLRLNGGAAEVRPPRSHHKETTMTVKKTDGEEPGKIPPPEPPKKDPPTMDEGALRLQAMEKMYADEVAKNARLNAELEAMKAAPADVKEEDVPPAVQDSIAAKRGALIEGARSVLGKDVKLDGLSAAEIHRKVISHRHPDVKLDGLSADFIAGRALGIIEASRSETARRADALASAHPGTGAARADASDPLAGLSPADALNALTATRFERDRAAAQE